ncbi:D-transpeptidase catalytic domain [Bartonella apis]
MHNCLSAQKNYPECAPEAFNNAFEVKNTFHLINLLLTTLYEKNTSDQMYRNNEVSRHQMKYFWQQKTGLAAALGILGFGLVGCATTPAPTVVPNDNVNVAPAKPVVTSTLLGTQSVYDRYEQTPDEPFKIPPVTVKIPEQYERTVVPYPTTEIPGTIIVEPENHYLYLITGDGQAIRYGVGVGASGLGFHGEARVQFKRKWPRWIPTADMVQRKPQQYKRFADGVPGGLHSPLGARALYLFQGNTDTYFRIHGTTQPSSIGKNVSAGCIRMLNKDVVDLFERVQIGSKVIVR